jgi:hypothetical protein
VRPLQIQLRIVAGDNAAYETESLQSKKLAVEVTDEAGSPVSGVAVTFRLPEEGATGLFPDGNRSTVVSTTEQGQAVAPNIRWGISQGNVSVRITAVKGSAHAGLLAQQQLTAKGGAAAAATTVPVGAPQVARPTIMASTAPPTPPPTPTAVSKATSSPSPVAAPISSQVTILTQPERAKPDVIVQPATTPIPTSAEAKATEPPPVSISSAPPGHGSSSKTKWILLGIAAAGAAAGVAFAMGGSKSSPAATAPSGATIGAPSISIGHP